jgi:hypothetical protein
MSPAFDRGYAYGQRDRQLRKSSNHARYSDAYSGKTEREFLRGYALGYQRR